MSNFCKTISLFNVIKTFEQSMMKRLQQDNENKLSCRTNVCKVSQTTDFGLPIKSSFLRICSMAVIAKPHFYVMLLREIILFYLKYYDNNMKFAADTQPIKRFREL